MKCRVTYEDGEPQKVKMGRGYFGGPTSVAYIRDSQAVVHYDNLGSTDFGTELHKLPFVDEVVCDE